MGGRTILLFAIGAALGLGVALASPPVARGADCPDHQPLTVGDLWTLWKADPGAEAPGEGSQAAARACFGSTPIRIRGYVGIVAGVGGTSMTGVAPLYWEWPGLYLFSTSRTVRWGWTAGHMYGIITPKRWGDLQERYAGAWVEVTARFNHGLAKECHGYGPKSLGRPTKAEAVAFCREQLVILSIARVPGLPATDAAGVATGLAAGSAAAPRPAPWGWPMALYAVAALAGGLAWWRRPRVH